MKSAALIIKMLLESTSHDEYRTSPEVKDENRTLYRMFYPSSRYTIDFAEDYKSEGWEQFDTDQDAPYFGNWTNKSKLMSLCYAEGDWILSVCKNIEGYNAEIKEMCDFYGTTPEFITIGEEGTTKYYQDRKEFFI